MRQQIAETLAAYHRRHSTVCEHTQLVEYGAAADAVMADVQPALDAKDAEMERLKAREAAALHRNSRLIERLEQEEAATRQAEAERDKAQADLEAYTTDVLSVLAKKNTALEKALADLERVRALLESAPAGATFAILRGNGHDKRWQAVVPRDAIITALDPPKETP